jgi:hypothetical protein
MCNDFDFNVARKSESLMTQIYAKGKGKVAPVLQLNTTP